jgi:hypothetical protein
MILDYSWVCGIDLTIWELEGKPGHHHPETIGEGL